MKKTPLFLLLLLMITAMSCSNDDDDTADTEEYFEYKYDNSDVEITGWTAQKNGDRYIIQAQGNGQNFAIEFNKYGNLASANSYSTSNLNFPLSQSFAYYSSYSFDFNLQNIDTDNQMIKADFDGLLYEDNYLINSTTHQVSGSFNVKYTEYPEDEISKVSCKIDNQDWHATNGDHSSSNQYETYSTFNDDKFIINLMYIDGFLNTCNNCSFTPNSNLRMQLDIYDPVNDDIIECPSTGTLSITNYSPPTGFSNGVIEGEFNFTATNPQNNQTHQIDNGHFKLIITP